MTRKCPLCNGCGKIEVETIVIVRLKGTELYKAAKRMKKQNFTIREIAKALGFKHPGSVSHLLSK